MGILNQELCPRCNEVIALESVLIAQQKESKPSRRIEAIPVRMEDEVFAAWFTVCEPCKVAWGVTIDRDEPWGFYWDEDEPCEASTEEHGTITYNALCEKMIKYLAQYDVIIQDVDVGNILESHEDYFESAKEAHEQATE